MQYGGSTSGAQRGGEPEGILQKIQGIQNTGGCGISRQESLWGCPLGLDDHDAQGRRFQHQAIVSAVSDANGRFDSKVLDILKLCLCLMPLGNDGQDAAQAIDLSAHPSERVGRQHMDFEMFMEGEDLLPNTLDESAVAGQKASET
jgi:hypothetical protein